MAAIAYWCVAQHVPALQQQIFSNAQAAVTSANAGDIDVSVDGRTATLSGVVSSDVQKAQLLSVVEDADGVRSVNDQLSVLKTSDSDDSIVIAENATDTTTTEIAKVVETPAEELVLAEAPREELADTPKENPDAAEFNKEESASNNVLDTVETADADLQVAELVINQAQPSTEEPSEAAALLAAELLSERANALIEQARKETASSLIDPETPRPDTAATTTPSTTNVTEAQRSIAATKLPSLKMQVVDGTLTITGDISDQDSLMVFIRSAMTTFDASYIVNSVQVHDDVAKADWLPALNQFLPNMGNVGAAGFDIIESQITLTGEAANSAEHDAVINEALSGLSELSLVERLSIASESAPISENTSAPVETALNSTSETTIEPAAPVDSLAQAQTLENAFESLDIEKILFESGSDVLTEDSMGVIETIARLFAEYPSISVEIDGHTDASGVAANNLTLSQLRANAVRDYLVQQQIAPERLSAYGFGDGVPIADNSTPAGRRLNRRIEFNF